LRPKSSIRKILKGDIVLQTDTALTELYNVDIVIQIDNNIVFECDIEYLNFNDSIRQISQNEYLLSLPMSELFLCNAFDSNLSIKCDHDLKIFFMTQNEMSDNPLEKDTRLIYGLRKQICNVDDIIDNKITLDSDVSAYEFIIISEHAQELKLTLTLNLKDVIRCSFDHMFSNHCYSQFYGKILPKNAISMILFSDHDSIPSEMINLKNNMMQPVHI